MHPDLLGACTNIEVREVGLAGGINHEHSLDGFRVKLLIMAVYVGPDGLQIGLVIVAQTHLHAACFS